MKFNLQSAAALAAAVSLVTTLAACGSGSDDAGKANGATSSPGSQATATPGGTSSAPANQPSSTAQPAAGSAKAVKLPATRALRQSLADTYFERAALQYPTESRAKVAGPTNVFYGKVGNNHYAIGNIGFSGNPVSHQDGPHVWHKVAGTDWEYQGDTGGEICGKVPPRLVKVWGRSCG